MSDGETLQNRLRALPVVQDHPGILDPLSVPAEPFELLIDWLESAIDAGVAQPHALALATSAANGAPNVRTLILKDVSDGALWFATLTSSPKGADIAENPRVAGVFYWREQGRQLRVTGTVSPGPREISDADFLKRHPNARATVIAGDQSAPLPDVAEIDERLAEAHSLMEHNPQYVPREWTAFRIDPDTIEFMQMNRTKPYTRVRYQRVGDTWRHEELWQ